MEVEGRFRPETVEARGALCVECLQELAARETLVDRCGAALCRACADEFYAACGGCGGLVPRDEGLARADSTVAGTLFCAECFRAPADGSGALKPLPTDEETEALVARYVALHAEKKRIDAEIDEVKDELKRVAGARPRVGSAVVLRAGDEGVRCSYSVRTTWDAEKLSEVEALLGEEFSDLFERKVTFSAVRERVDEFLKDTHEATAAARELVRSAAQVSETATINVIASRKKK